MHENDNVQKMIMNVMIMHENDNAQKMIVNENDNA